jgi:wyosine [tRNA(Phe)-imidazoG37] synthetase (radical SAM superfamily)
MRTARRNGNRTITVKKLQLIEQLKVNMANHIKEYENAVVAYKEEALKQLSQQIKEVEEGSLVARLNLVTPINSSKEYEKVIEMFEWEINDDVELEQDEFNQFVLDEFDFAVNAKFANTMYFAKG